ncbi:MAG: MBL fold metallo-hydrolase [Anaerolineae bacterium]|nr:MBL fold metallo-hydrolase [Anaerolineae bacterium]
MLEITCVVEDTIVPDSALRSEHGIAFYIKTPGGRLLFDTGESGDVLVHNAAHLHIDLSQIDALALSHAHLDHTGGVPDVLKRTRPMIPLYASPDIFRERFVRSLEQPVSYCLKLSRDELEQHVDLRLSADPVEIVPGVWTTGEITDRTSFEGRGNMHQIRVDGEWKPDPYRDDLSLVLETGDGLVVLLGCGHAGLLNILRQVKRHFDGDIIAIAGGTHLASATDAMLQQAIDELSTTYNRPRLYPNHCTGQRAVNALADAFGSQVQPCPPGTILTF